MGFTCYMISEMASIDYVLQYSYQIVNINYWCTSCNVLKVLEEVLKKSIGDK